MRFLDGLCNWIFDTALKAGVCLLGYSFGAAIIKRLHLGQITPGWTALTLILFWALGSILAYSIEGTQQ
jgi:hypothetical protein